MTLVCVPHISPLLIVVFGIHVTRYIFLKNWLKRVPFSTTITITYVTKCNYITFQSSLASKVLSKITSHLSFIYIIIEDKHHFFFYGLGNKNSVIFVNKVGTLNKEL